MKKIILLSIISLFIINLSAQEYQLNKDGSISKTEKRQIFTEFQINKAKQNPGVPVYIDFPTKENFRITGWLNYEYDEVQYEGLVYDGEKFSTEIEAKVTPSKEKFLWNILFSILAMLAMIVSNIYKKFFAVLAFGFAFLTFLSTFLVFVSPTFNLPFVFALLSALFAFAAVPSASPKKENNEGYWIFPIIFYIFMVCNIVFTYLFF